MLATTNSEIFGIIVLIWLFYREIISFNGEYDSYYYHCLAQDLFDCLFGQPFSADLQQLSSAYACADVLL